MLSWRDGASSTQPGITGRDYSCEKESSWPASWHSSVMGLRYSGAMCENCENCLCGTVCENLSQRLGSVPSWDCAPCVKLPLSDCGKVKFIAEKFDRTTLSAFHVFVYLLLRELSNTLLSAPPSPIISTHNGFN